MKKAIFFTIGFFLATLLYAQPSKWDAQKRGHWRFENHLPEKGYSLRNATLTAADNLAFKKNISALAEWFHQNHSMLKIPTGYDLRGLCTYKWGDYTTKLDCEYGIPTEIGFLFELFDKKGGKWTVEPPQYNFQVNALYGGHGGFFGKPDVILTDDPNYKITETSAYKKALANMQQYICVYPLMEQPYLGVDIYQAYRDGWQQNGKLSVVVYNPERPPYWLPVTVQELADVFLAYYSLLQAKEMDRMILKQLKEEIAELSPEELAAPAYTGHESHFVLKANGIKQGYRIMRFNPAYWDKSLPQSAIQFMTFGSANFTEDEMAEHEKRSYPIYPQLFFNKIKWDEVAKQIQRK